MPIIKRAIKKLRHDRKRTQKNEEVDRALHGIIKKTRKNPTKTSLSKAFQALDKAAKIHSIHKNKASRLKSRLSKLIKK
jgi:small subunit ribosomal protein S20